MSDGTEDDMTKNVRVLENELQTNRMKPYCKIGEVDTCIEGDTRVSARMFEEVTKDVRSQSPTMLHLYQNILNSLKRFEGSGMYKKVDVNLEPGETQDAVMIKYIMKPASSYFANISHQFDRFGQASMASKIGFRNILGYFDKVTFEYNKALNKSRRSYYNLQWYVPYNFITQKAQDSFLASVSHSTTLLDKNCSETKDSVSLVFTAIDPAKESERYTLTFESALRKNYVTSSNYRLLEDFLPSVKNSIKYSTQAFSSVQMGSRVHKGSSLNYSTELGLPIISDAVFIKQEANYKKYIKLKSLKFISQRFRSWNLEYTANLGAVKSLNSNKLSLNESFSMGSIRGVNDIDVDHYEGKSSSSQQQQQQEQRLSLWDNNNLNLQLKNSLKLNFYDFPGVQKSGVIPFYHASAGYFYRIRNGQGASPLKSFQKEDILDHIRCHLRASAGLGIGVGIGGGAKIEILYNFFHFSKHSDNRSKLELRISMDD